jgi:hypothetical protein
LLHTRRALEEALLKYGKLLHGERSSCELRRSHAGPRDRMKGRAFGVRKLAARERSCDARDRHQDRGVMTFGCNGRSVESADGAVVVRVRSE